MGNQHKTATSKKQLTVLYSSAALFLAVSTGLLGLSTKPIDTSMYMGIALLFMTLLSANLAWVLYRTVLTAKSSPDLSHLNTLIDKGASSALAQTMISLNARFEQKLCVLMTEIDCALNDTAAGTKDDLQNFVSSKLIEQLRETDIVNRHEFNTFLILLPNTGKDEGYRLAEKIRLGVRATQYENSEVGLSVGCVELRKHEGYDDIIIRANHALRCAIQGGGDRTVVA